MASTIYSPSTLAFRNLPGIVPPGEIQRIHIVSANLQKKKTNQKTRQTSPRVQGGKVYGFVLLGVSTFFLLLLLLLSISVVFWLRRFWGWKSCNCVWSHLVSYTPLLWSNFTAKLCCLACGLLCASCLDSVADAKVKLYDVRMDFLQPVGIVMGYDTRI